MATPMEPGPRGRGPGRTPALLCAFLLASALRAQQPPPVLSPDVLPDGRVTFRILAPGAQSVAVQGLRHLPVQPMAKDGAGLWSVTVGPFAPDVYSYTFLIDGATVTDPHDRDIKKYFSSESLFEVPGSPPILAAMQAVPHGVLHHQFYASRTRGRDAGLVVYTPPGYDARASRLYPVVYLLHGFGDREVAWVDAGHANAIVDNLIAQGRIEPVMLVMPYGHPVPVEDRGRYKDYEGRNEAAMAQDLLTEVIPLVERDYRADARPEKRAVVGLSMGGGQSLTIGLGHPELFKWVGGFSSSAPERDLEGTFAAVLKDPSARPHVLWIAVGRDDFLLKRNQAFDAWLTGKGIAHTFIVSDGAHEWPVWRADLPQFLELIFH